MPQPKCLLLFLTFFYICFLVVKLPCDFRYNYVSDVPDLIGLSVPGGVAPTPSSPPGLRQTRERTSKVPLCVTPAMAITSGEGASCVPESERPLISESSDSKPHRTGTRDEGHSFEVRKRCWVGEARKAGSPLLASSSKRGRQERGENQTPGPCAGHQGLRSSQPVLVTLINWKGLQQDVEYLPRDSWESSDLLTCLLII